MVGPLTEIRKVGKEKKGNSIWALLSLRQLFDIQVEMKSCRCLVTDVIRQKKKKEKDRKKSHGHRVFVKKDN